MRHLRTTRCRISRWSAAIADRLRRVLRHLREWWQWHWTRVAEEHGYAEALTAVLLEAVELLTANPRLRYLAHEMLAGYVALLKALRPTQLDDPA